MLNNQKGNAYDSKCHKDSCNINILLFNLQLQGIGEKIQHPDSQKKLSETSRMPTQQSNGWLLPRGIPF